MLAAVEWSMKARNVNISRSQNGSHEQSESHVKRAATTVQSEKDAKQDEDEERRRCSETKDEEQGRDGNTYRNLDEAQFSNFLSFRVHDSARMTPNDPSSATRRTGAEDNP